MLNDRKGIVFLAFFFLLAYYFDVFFLIFFPFLVYLFFTINFILVSYFKNKNRKLEE